MTAVFLLLRLLHITAGMLAFFVAPGALLTRKGALWHRRWGKIYFWSMAMVAGTALLMTWIRPNLFLAMVAVFSFYMAFSGYRVLYQKRPREGQGPTALDWLGVGLIALGSIGLILLGLFRLAAVHAGFGTVAVVFGALGLFIGSSDARRFLRPSVDRRAWLYTHIGNMIGAYIATVSAFSAVNLTILPPVLRWLWPTLVGLPVIFVCVNSEQRKSRAAIKPGRA